MASRRVVPVPVRRRRGNRTHPSRVGTRFGRTGHDGSARDAQPRRFLLNVSFKPTGHDWVGFHTAQSRASSPDWVAFVERCTPRDLELFGFPAPGHAIWDAELIDLTVVRYPKLDLTPWRAALGSDASEEAR